MALPPLIEPTNPERQRRFYDAYKAGARDAFQHLAPRRDKCDMCHRVQSRGLHLFRCPDGTTYKLGPDCREAYNALDVLNIGELERLISPRGLEDIDGLEITD